MPSSSLPVTRSTLLTRALQRADYQNSTFVDATSSTNEVADLVDTSLAKMHNMLVNLHEDYFVEDYYFTILNNIDTYTMPPDYMKVRAVFYVDTSGYRFPLRRMNISDLTNVPISVSYAMTPVGYVLKKNNLVLFPRPSNTGNSLYQILVMYVPQYRPPLSDNQPIEYAVAFGWDEWVVNDVAYQIRLKANEPSQEIERERDLIHARIRGEAIRRDEGQPPRVRDTGWGSSGATWSRFSQFAIK